MKAILTLNNPTLSDVYKPKPKTPTPTPPLPPQPPIIEVIKPPPTPPAIKTPTPPPGSVHFFNQFTIMYRILSVN
jgi:hypothetical protein